VEDIKKKKVMKRRFLSSGRGRWKVRLLHSVQKVQVCDATDDATTNNSRTQKSSIVISTILLFIMLSEHLIIFYSRNKAHFKILMEKPFGIF
jgi:hypothetical protein